MAIFLLKPVIIGTLFMCFASKVTSLNVTFDKMGTLYLPYTYTPTTMYDLGKDAAEQMSYDSVAKLLYSIGHTNIHVIDLSDADYNMTVLYHVSYDNVDVTDVELCGNFLFVAFDNETDRMHGFVNVYEAYNRQSNSLNLIHSIVVGAVPDMIHPTSDCSKVLVAIEAEPYNSAQGFIDPPGGIGMITFSATPAGNYTYTVLGFEAFNSRVAELEKTGVRFVYRANNNNFSNDLEPEYIAFNHDQTKAYVSLQENNAIAVVDIQSQTIENIFGLGFKNWSATTIDPSDRDGGIPATRTTTTTISVVSTSTTENNNNIISEKRDGYAFKLDSYISAAGVPNNGFLVFLTPVLPLHPFLASRCYPTKVYDYPPIGINMQSWPVLGMYQPDAITIWTHNNIDYILTANEGDAKDYPPFFSEETRVGDETLSAMFEPNATERSQLQEDAHLGRLKITNMNGKNNTTDEFDHLYSYGARSFSIRRADTMELIYDSGNDISHRIAMMKPYLFNSNSGPGDTIISSVDSRSDDKGAETESFAIAQVGNYTLVMVGNERPGTIAVYSIDNRLDTIQPMFVTLLSDVPQVNETWKKVYDERRLSMLDPEDMRFLSKSESPNGEPLLIVSGSYSGTISILKVTVNTEGSGDPSSTQTMKIHPGLLILTAVLVFVNKCLF